MRAMQTVSQGIKITFILILLYIKVSNFSNNAVFVVLKCLRIIELFGCGCQARTPAIYWGPGFI